MRVYTVIPILILSVSMVLSTIGAYPVLGKSGGPTFKVAISPTSETIQRGSNFRYTIFVTGPKSLTGIMTLIGASVSPTGATGLTFRTTGYDIPINVATPLLVGNTTLSTPTGTYTFTITARGTQSPIVGVVETATTQLVLT